MAEQPETLDEQTPAQWAVRWFAIVAVAGLCVSVPLVHLTWHVLLGNEQPIIRTRSQVEMPQPTSEAVLSGDWMERAERSLQEDSPVVWWLRGHWNEMRYRLGVPHSGAVQFGRDGWMFLKSTCFVGANVLRRHAEPRKAAILSVRDRLRAAGAELVLVVVPDKVRVYAQHVFPSGRLPDGHREQYADLLAELQALRVPTVDLETPMLAAANTGPIELYYERDTHWRPGGALIASQAIAAVIEQKFGRELSPRVPMRLSGPSTSHTTGDLTMMCGMLTTIRDRAEGGDRTIALSMLTDELAEARQYYGLESMGSTSGHKLTKDNPEAEILLVGTSFAKENGHGALAFAIGRPVYGVTRNGAAALQPMREALKEIESGQANPKVVVWQIVERGFRDSLWYAPKL